MVVVVMARALGSFLFPRVTQYAICSLQMIGGKVYKTHDERDMKFSRKSDRGKKILFFSFGFLSFTHTRTHTNNASSFTMYRLANRKIASKGLPLWNKVK